jgi:hypothetical protein
MSAQPEDFRPAIAGAIPTERPLAGTDVPQAIQHAIPTAASPAGTDVPTATIDPATPERLPSPWGLLSLLAETLDDLERTRIAAENRARSLAQVYDLEGEPPHVQAVALAEAIKALEHGAELQLKRALRQHPLGAWVRRSIGVGEKQGARLLAAIGDPYWNTLHDRPRTVSELWAYCGYHTLPADQTSRDAPARAVGGAQVSDTDQATSGSHTRIARRPDLHRGGEGAHSRVRGARPPRLR